MQERVIIGEGERAGWALSQPLHELAITSLPVRFIMNEDGPYFTLEAWDENQQKWLEVPVFRKEKTK